MKQPMQLQAALLLALLLPCHAVSAGEPLLQPLPLSDAHTLEEIKKGQATFNRFYSARSGLGPIFSSNSCVACHTQGSRGPIVIEKLAAVEADGLTPAEDQHSYLPYGPNVRPFAAWPAKVGVKRGDGLAREGKLLFSAVRMPPPMFGRGYIEAVAEEEIFAQERLQAARADAIKGRVNRVGAEQRAGRFGLKARIAGLDDFNADAFVTDIGLTSPLRPVGLPNPEGITDPSQPEISAETNHQVSQFIRFLEIERELPSQEGLKLFKAVDCAACHVPSLATDSSSPLGKLGVLSAPIFSDLLLHDMGVALSDAQKEENAGPRDWRTPPLIQVRHQSSLMHDGRAGTVEKAIALHGAEDSESFGAYRKFMALSPEEQSLLVEFVKGL